jgi:hypothetical protein
MGKKSDLSVRAVSITGKTAGPGCAGGVGGIGVLTLGAALLYLLLVLNAAPALAAQSDAPTSPCPNEALRVGPSANLPDCRAYEKVSPAEKNGYEVQATPQGLGGGGVQVRPDGDAVSFGSFGGAFAGSRSAGVNVSYLARRSSQGWTSEGIDPPLFPSRQTFLAGVIRPAFSEDMTTGIVDTVSPLVGGPEEGLGTFNLFSVEYPSTSTRLLTPGGPAPTVGGFPGQSGVLASTDAGIVAFETSTNYSSTRPGPEFLTKVYRSVGGQLELASILPDGEPTSDSAGIGGEGSPLSASFEHALSADGSRLYFSDSGTTTQLYEREQGVSVQVSQPNAGVIDPNGTQSASYFDASSDGTKAFFVSGQKLTADATTGPEDHGSDLYEFDLGAPAGHRLRDLSVDATDVEGAQVQGVVGASEDGSYVYFVALGQLKAGEGTPGVPNLYLHHGGETTFIATLDPGDNRNWDLPTEQAPTAPARVTRDGRSMVFTTTAAQPGYDNAGNSEVYLFNAEDDQLRCVSCNPTGAAATSPSRIGNENYNQGYLKRPNNLSEDGRRVFFETAESLVPVDGNEQRDVYEYQGGTLSLISAGNSAEEAIFVGASPDGDDAFIVTRQKLVPNDQDEASDLYDARVDGGFAEEPEVTGTCEADACRGPSSAPAALASASSSLLGGPANQRRSRHHRKKTRQKKKHHIKTQHKHVKQKGHGQAKSRARQAGHQHGGAK